MHVVRTPRSISMSAMTVNAVLSGLLFGHSLRVRCRRHARLRSLLAMPWWDDRAIDHRVSRACERLRWDRAPPVGGRRISVVTLPVTKSHPRVRVEVIVANDAVGVESEQVVLGCANLNQLRHVVLFSL